jgi:hypothetical protein
MKEETNGLDRLAETFLIQLYDFFHVNKVTLAFKVSLFLSLSLSHTHIHTQTQTHTHTHTYFGGHKQNNIRNKRIHSQISNAVVFIWNLLQKKSK